MHLNQSNKEERFSFYKDMGKLLEEQDPAKQVSGYEGLLDSLYSLRDVGSPSHTGLQHTILGLYKQMVWQRSSMSKYHYYILDPKRSQQYKLEPKFLSRLGELVSELIQSPSVEGLCVKWSTVEDYRRAVDGLMSLLMNLSNVVQINSNYPAEKSSQSTRDTVDCGLIFNLHQSGAIRMLFKHMQHVI